MEVFKFPENAEKIDEKKFERRIVKLAYVMEQCEKHKAQDPSYSLYFNELADMMRRRMQESKMESGIDGDDMTKIGQSANEILMKNRQQKFMNTNMSQLSKISLLTG